jgi:hypothetical protein
MSSLFGSLGWRRKSRPERERVEQDVRWEEQALRAVIENDDDIMIRQIFAGDGNQRLSTKVRVQNVGPGDHTFEFGSFEITESMLGSGHDSQHRHILFQDGSTILDIALVADSQACVTALRAMGVLSTTSVGAVAMGWEEAAVVSIVNDDAEALLALFSQQDSRLQTKLKAAYHGSEHIETLYLGSFAVLKKSMTEGGTKLLEGGTVRPVRGFVSGMLEGVGGDTPVKSGDSLLDIALLNKSAACSEVLRALGAPEQQPTESTAEKGGRDASNIIAPEVMKSLEEQKEQKSERKEHYTAHLAAQPPRLFESRDIADQHLQNSHGGLLQLSKKKLNDADVKVLVGSLAAAFEADYATAAARSGTPPPSGTTAATTAATRLFLKRNKITLAGVACIADFLSIQSAHAASTLPVQPSLVQTSSFSLHSLDLSYNNVGNDGALALVQALEEHPSLSHLFLAHTQLRPAGVEAIATALSRNAFPLQALVLAANTGMGDAGGEALARMLKTNTTVRSLSLTNTHLGDAGAAPLAEALRTNSTLTTLKLDRNQITGKGVAAMATSLTAPSCSLTKLVLGVNELGDDGAEAIAKALSVAGGGGDGIGGSAGGGGGGGAGVASKKACPLEILDVSSNGITGRGIGALARALNGNKILRQLAIDQVINQCSN